MSDDVDLCQVLNIVFELGFKFFPVQREQGVLHHAQGGNCEGISAMDYDLFVQLYFGIVVCVLTAGHTLAIISAIKCIFLAGDSTTVSDVHHMTEMSVLCRPVDEANDSSEGVENAGYFEDDHDTCVGCEAYVLNDDKECGGCNDPSDLVQCNLGEDGDPPRPESNKSQER